MTERSIHQILVGAGGGDAITSMARALQVGLRTIARSEIFAHYLAPEARGDVRPLHELGGAARGDLLVYHVSYGEPIVTQALLSRPERIVLVYHNITPSEHFLMHDPQFAAGLLWGRYELSALHDRVVLAVADSTYNAVDLRAHGYDDVSVVPAGLHPSRLTHVAPSASLAEQLHERFPTGYVLGVSQLLPHKRFETIVQAMHLVRWVHELDIGLLIVGNTRMPKYRAALELHARRLNLSPAWFLGEVSEAELATAYRMASIYLTTSAHEGLALPPLEAMSFGVPVIARAAGALAETIGGAGVVLPPDAGPMLVGEAVAEVATNPNLRHRLRDLGQARVAHIEAEDPVAQFLKLVRQVA